jgi:hypothetical protein
MEPEHVEVSMRSGDVEVMFTEVFADGVSRTYWLPFWRACWHSVRLIFANVKIVDRTQ